MTTEEKQLLLKDLCGRLLYGVIINYFNIPQNSSVDAEVIGYFNGFIYIDNHSLNPEFVKPYLRPMSSMTESEFKEWRKLVDLQRVATKDVFDTAILSFKNVGGVTDWLNAHYFDYQGLIEKGLALEAPEGMYKTE